MPNRFVIYENEYLARRTIGYFNRYYTGFKQPDNPDFLNTLKNTYNNETNQNLLAARDIVTDILLEDLPIIMREHMPNCTCVCVSRAKALNTYSRSQLMLFEGIKNAVNEIELGYDYYVGDVINGVMVDIKDGTDCIVRVKNTRTTHFKKEIPNYTNDGDVPYPGITKATCQIDRSKIINQNIILIDDIYTNNVNIDEDCIQALYDNGARNVIFYAIGYTRRN